jgi:hypothetical protein
MRFKTFISTVVIALIAAAGIGSVPFYAPFDIE